MAGTSTGDGRYAMTASSSGCTPLFLNALPQSTAVILLDSTAATDGAFAAGPASTESSSVR